MKLIYLVFLVFTVILGASFAVLNATPVEINYYIGQSSLPLALLLVIALSLGGLIGMFTGMVILFRIHRENRKLRKQVLLSSQEISNLRTLPLQDA